MELELQLDAKALEQEPFDVVSKRVLAPEELPPTTLEARFIEPVSATIAVASIALLAERIVIHWLRSKEQGVEIDLRTQPTRVSRLAGTPQGFLVVIKPDGSTELMQAAYDNPAQLAGVVEKVSALFKSGK